MSFVYFWGSKARSNVLGVECLSQWYPATFYDECNVYANAEQYMMYQKALLFGDERIASEILKTTNPKHVKSLGRQVSNFNEEVWNKNRVNIVRRGNMLKFSQNIQLKGFLLSFPVGVEFVEASPYDRVWGIGLRESDPRAKNKSTWQGDNLLGQVLTQVATDLRGGW